MPNKNKCVIIRFWTVPSKGGFFSGPDHFSSIEIIKDNNSYYLGSPKNNRFVGNYEELNLKYKKQEFLLFDSQNFLPMIDKLAEIKSRRGAPSSSFYKLITEILHSGDIKFDIGSSSQSSNLRAELDKQEKKERKRHKETMNYASEYIEFGRNRLINPIPDEETGQLRARIQQLEADVASLHDELTATGLEIEGKNQEIADLNENIKDHSNAHAEIAEEVAKELADKSALKDISALKNKTTKPEGELNNRKSKKPGNILSTLLGNSSKNDHDPAIDLEKGLSQGVKLSR